MKYEYTLSGPARRYLVRLDLPTQVRFRNRLRQLCTDPFDRQHSKPLTNSHLRVSRVGSWRILYEVREPELLIYIEEIGPRGQVYRRL